MTLKSEAVVQAHGVFRRLRFKKNEVGSLDTQLKKGGWDIRHGKKDRHKEISG